MGDGKGRRRMNESTMIYYGFLLGGVLAASFSQILLKKGAMNSYSSFLREYLNPWVAGGYLLLVGSTVLNICGLRGLSFLNGPVMESFGYVFVLLLSRLFFGEKLTKRKLAGVGCILAGMLIYYL